MGLRSGVAGPETRTVCDKYLREFIGTQWELSESRL